MKNSRPMIAGRWLNQWVRRTIIELFEPWMPWAQPLRLERTLLSCKPNLTEEQRERLREIAWSLGQGLLIKLTPEERAEQYRIATEILNEIPADE